MNKYTAKIIKIDADDLTVLVQIIQIILVIVKMLMDTDLNKENLANENYR